ncbi:MAG: protein kinase domain-containing protein, partial [Beijerinckiaceae bacterium]
LLNELVAIKEYLPSYLAARFSNTTVGPKSDVDREAFREGVQAFLNEARVIALFHHQNIAQVRRFFELNGTGYIVMNYENGRPLSKMIADGPIPNAQLRQILLGVLSGLAAVHERAKLHRDIKPSNIIVRQDGSPVLIDFGAARDFENRLTRPMTMIMSPGYAPPEQYGAGGEQGPWTDFYALGATAYHCLTGKTPADSLYRSRLHGSGKDPLVPAEKAGAGRYDARLLEAVDKMLRLDESKRPQTAAEICKSLEASTELTITAPPGRKPPGPQKSQWKLVAAGLAAVLILAAGLYAGLSWFEHRKLERQTAEMEALAKAGYNRDQIDQVLRSCAPDCSQAAKAEAERRLELMAREAAQYRAAFDLARLLTYVRDCRACEFRSSAEAEILSQQRDAEHRDLARELQAAGYDRSKLNNFLAVCGSSCPEELRQDARARLAVLDAEKAQYKAAGDDIERLSDYSQTCQGCEFKDIAEQRVAKLRGDKEMADRLAREAQSKLADDARREADEQRRISEQNINAERDNPPIQYHYVTGLDPNGNNWLALRTAPSFQAPWSTTHMGPGTLLTVFERSGEWLHVRLQNGETGWANERYVACCTTASSPPPAPAQKRVASYYYVAGIDENSRDPWLALRNAPSRQAPWSTTHMPNGTLLTMMEQNGEWYHVRLKSGETGWANSKYVACCRQMEE